MLGLSSQVSLCRGFVLDEAIFYREDNGVRVAQCPPLPQRIPRSTSLRATLPDGHGSLKVLSQFSLEAICGMLSYHDQRCFMKESDDDDQLQGAHFPQDIIVMGVRWYLAYPLSYGHVEELMEARGVFLDHATIQRWVVKYSPVLAQAFHRRKRPVWVSWRMDEPSIKIKGQWYSLARAVDKTGQTIDFRLTEHRNEQAALRFLKKTIRRHGVPEKITIDGSAANDAAIKTYNATHGTAIETRKREYLNNIIEQDHRGMKRIARPMFGFKTFDAAQSPLTGIELMPMLRKGQLAGGREQGRSAAEQCYALAA